jgi:deoxyadenosine/deoxycytidine kinase
MNFQKSYGFFEEPVEEWATIKDGEGKTILEKFYANPAKYAFSFQMMAYITRLTVLKNAIKNNTTATFQATPLTFSIEGNIGTGKSTLVRHLQTHFKCAENSLKKYDVLMTERSVFSDYRVFAQMLFDDQKIEDVEFVVYKKWFDDFIQELPPMKFIYIRADPSISFDRVNKRARIGETTIPLAYLENCHKYHDDWLLKEIDPKNLLIIDANEDINANTELLQQWIKQIEAFVDST